jgi:drug/metabolite transporter (DMT)-like permease
VIGPALLLGGAGALCWGVGALLTAPSSRALGASRSVLWLGIAAVTFGVPLALVGGPLRVRAAEVPALLAAAAFLLVATQLWSVLVGRGKVSLAAPIVACDGAVAALAAVLTGHELPVLAYAGLTLMVAGLVVLAAGGHSGPAEAPAAADRADGDLTRPAAIALAVLAAGCYGGMLFCAGGIEGTSPLWTVTLARAVATVGALGLCLRQGAVRPTRAGLPFAVAAGVLDVAAFALFVAGARHEPAVSAVAVSQYGAVATLAAVAFLDERLTGRQTAAVAVLVAGAGVVAATGA